MQVMNRSALAILAVVGITGTVWGQVDTGTSFGEKLVARSYQDTLDMDQVVETSVGSISKASIILNGLAVVEVTTEGIEPGDVTPVGMSCVLGMPCDVPGDAEAVTTPSPSFTTTSGTSVGDYASVIPLDNCIMPVTVPQVLAGVGATAGIDLSGRGIGTSTREMGRASADSCWRTNVQSGTCCAQGKTTQREYGIAVLAAIQTFEVTRPPATLTTITTTYTVSYEFESNSESYDTTGPDGCPGATPMCPSVSPMSDAVIFFEVSVEGSGSSGVIDSDLFQGAIVAREDGTFGLLGEFDTTGFDPSGGSDSLSLNSTFIGMIDEVVFDQASVQTTLTELLKADIDDDGDVCGDDRVAFMDAYNSSIGDAEYTIRADFDLDGDVDSDDLDHLNNIGCTADLDCDGSLTIFDQQAFGNAFDAMDPVADWDGDGSFTIFDYQEFGNTYDLGCP